MRIIRPAGLLLAGCYVLLASVVLGQPAPRPLAEQVIEIAPWESSSVSPSDGTRAGWSDGRRYAISPDGKWIASEDRGNGRLELWSTATGQSAGRFGKIEDPVALAFSPSGKQIVTAPLDNPREFAVELWDVESKTRVRRLDEEANVSPMTALAFSPDGKTIALAPSRSRDRSAARPIPRPAPRGGAGREPAREAAAAELPPAPICLWSTETGDELQRFAPFQTFTAAGKWEGTGAGIEALAWSPDGRLIATVIRGRGVVLWEVASGAVRTELGHLPWIPGKSDKVFPSIAFSQDGRLVACGAVDGTVRIWDIVESRPLPPLVHGGDGVRAVAFDAAGEKLYSLGVDNRLLTWSAKPEDLNWRGEPEQLDSEALERLWRELHGDDLRARYFAEQRLIAAPKQTLPFLRETIKPAQYRSDDSLYVLVHDLASDSINLRKRAMRELEKLGEPALLAIQQSSGRRGPAEEYELIRTRVMERLTEQLRPTVWRDATTGVALLEAIGGEEAEARLTELAAGTPNAAITRAARDALLRIAAQRKPASGDSPDALWSRLASDDARAAYVAMQDLAKLGNENVAALQERLQELAPTQSLDIPQQIAQLVRELDHDDFGRRDRASAQLARFGTLATPALREAFEHDPTPEARERIMVALGAARAQPKPIAEQMQALRGIEVLERIGSAAAQQALEAVAKAAREDSPLAAAARESIGRMK